MYSVSGYGKMIVDRSRTDAYVRALRQTVKPESVVLDLGCGPGLFALVAAQLGARRVFAVETDNVIQVGREAAREHGFGDRIEFIQEMSTNIDLPEQADVIVSDLRGVLPLYAHHVESIIDARSRFLAPGGILIAACDRLWVTIVEVPEQYDEIVRPWNQDGFNMHSARNFAVNTWRKMQVKPEEILAEPVCWYELDYYNITEANFHAVVDIAVARKGTAHGLVIWFDAELVNGIGFSSAPGGEMIYGNAFFTFKEEVQVDPGDRFEIRLDARLIGDDYVWRWETNLASKQISFKQSTLFGAPLSPSQLRKRANTFVPQANDAGAIARYVLSQMDGTNSIEQIAAKLVKEFPHCENDALDLVAEISEKYSV